MSCILKLTYMSFDSHYSFIKSIDTMFLDKSKLLFFILLLTNSLLNAQSYHTALGLRLGTDVGFTIQQRVGNSQTIEGIIQTGLFRRTGQFAALYQQHNSLISKGFNFYYGVGPQIGWYEIRETRETSTTGGMALIVGAEMSLGKLILSYDIKPNVNVFGGAPFINVDSAISVRTAIVKKGKYSKKNKQKAGKGNGGSHKSNGGIFKKKTHKM
jgi:hypothetical protein